MATYKQTRIKGFKEFLAELKIKRLYHVGSADLKPGEDLVSLQTRLGDKKAKTEVKKRWGSSLHVTDRVWLSDNPNIGSHEMFDKAKYGRKERLATYEIWPGKRMKNPVEHGYFPTVKDRIEARYVRYRYNPETGHRERWNVSKNKNESSVLNTPTPSPKAIAKKFDLPLAKINTAIKKGMGVEKEHSKRKKVTREIATDHVGELGPPYYKELDKMETKLKKKEGKKAG